MKSGRYTEEELLEKIRLLEEENELLRTKSFIPGSPETVKVPESIRPLFDEAEKTVGDYFRTLKTDPATATIEISGQRYVLVRASALSLDFLSSIKSLYADRGEKEAISIGRNFLFDIAHVIGINDAKNFHERMHLTDPIAKLSAGPVHFAYSGWAQVNIRPESSPTPDENFFLLYDHPFSFESDAWIRNGVRSDIPVCIMNSGYSSGWCEESFGIQLTAVEISCKACGDEQCTFIMAPPSMIKVHLDKFLQKHKRKSFDRNEYQIPSFFERKKIEEEKEKARKKAEESDKAKTEFLANMSHELRTPLNAVIGYIDVLLKEKMSADHHDYLKIIKDSSRILQNLTNDILDLSKIEAGQIAIEEIPLAVRPFLNTMGSVASSLIAQEGKPIEVNVEVDPRISTHVNSDPTRLQQILYNLVSNAVKFTRTGHIKLSLELINDHTLKFCVKDTGIGIPQSKQETIFKMFVQADTSTTRLYGGTGLGLTISKKLAELMGGEFKIASTVDQGSTFCFTHPYKPSQVEIAEESADNQNLKDKNPVILLVEDNLINQRLTKLILEKADFTVLTARHGKEALDHFNSNKNIELIVMDIQMPVMDGLTAIKLIREKESTDQLPPIPIIALTADAIKEDVDKCFEAGCNNYLTKPINAEVLILSMRKALKRD